ncbi:protein of unknown function [Chitinophaga sp. CF118]|uniref:DUF4091 domain-containing protein n=1 Tax=Chitinophaga sp. CF118 TaxID=1884367 RepID=UPI0008E0B8DA|nr:glycoside hydrolase domain-containing protein [Chitinophaga sp. CF118]SFD13104.1 protein of unknown function [Chitinophaga sp. CF118]
MFSKLYWAAIPMALTCASYAQQAKPLPYQDLPDPRTLNKSSWDAVTGPDLHARFASADIRYEKGSVPDAGSLQSEWQVKAWKGEQVHTQLLIWTTKPLTGTTVSLLPLQDGKGHTIPSPQISASFVRYVMTDELNKDGTGCGFRSNSADFDSSLVEDAIDVVTKQDIPAYTTQPVWLSIKVPSATPAGVYHGAVKVGKITLPYQVQVLEHTLPPASKWQYHLDLWQSPYAISRVYKVKDWSPAHFAVMKPYMKMLADAGQKVITTTLIYDPWNGQTEDIYGSMIKWTHERNGSWSYDYTIFDKWVQFMLDLGISKEINCYSMIPWNLKFWYYDEVAGKDTFIVAKPGSAEYDAHWRPMLTDFVKHLRAKGWFNITTIAMDERTMEDMKWTIGLIRSVDKDFKVSLAGSYHAEIESGLADLCVASAEVIPADVLAMRKKRGDITTYYTYCHEGHPNTFTFSPPAEATWLSWYAAMKGFDGYLRWAYNSWVKDPLHDSRFRNWAAGDTYFVYPGARTSIRFERLKEGIQDYEKVRLLREEFTRENNTAKLQQLDALLAPFQLDALKTQPAAEMVRKAQAGLNEL